MSENINNEVYGAGEGYPSTGADVGGQAGPAVSLACDRGRMGVDHQAPIHVITTGEEEEGDIEMEEAPIEQATSKLINDKLINDKLINDYELLSFYRIQTL